MIPQIYLRPLGLSTGAGQALSYSALEISRRGTDQVLGREVIPLSDLAEHLAALDGTTRRGIEAWLNRLSARPGSFAGLDLSRPQVMGVINVTPDSFSDGGDHLDSDRAVAQGLEMREAGASLLDVGGESTRPGAAEVALDEELRRVIPVVEGLARAGAKVSVDTRRARVMAAAIEAGASIVNDVTALAGDPDSLDVVVQAQVPVILMHMQGEPRTMQLAPSYADAARDIYDWLAGRIAVCEAAGLARSHIAIDPGIGFGKTLEHNLQILDHLALFHGLGCPILLGVSRKSFIGRIAGEERPKSRGPGSLAAALAGVARGVQILR
ncbi:MAG: dihydropteroate synthase, partial [Pseudomonadota bacterium]